jgi:hypothetical protein
MGRQLGLCPRCWEPPEAGDAAPSLPKYSLNEVGIISGGRIVQRGVGAQLREKTKEVKMSAPE